jgi:hypothetical protein
MHSFSQMFCTFDVDTIASEIEFGEYLDKKVKIATKKIEKD